MNARAGRVAPSPRVIVRRFALAVAVGGAAVAASSSAGAQRSPASAAPASASAASVASLPLHVVVATTPATSLVILLSGDGGWASIDRRIADDLAARGAGVVGVDSRAYLMQARTPDEAAADLARVIRYYFGQWAVERVALVGYSRGAGIAPFVANRLPADLRARLTLIALVAPAERAGFQFHWADLLSERSRPSDRPILPELERLRGTPVLCVYGHDEKESLCRLADTSAVRVHRRAGGHHLDRDYDAIAAEILGMLAPLDASGR